MLFQSIKKISHQFKHDHERYSIKVAFLSIKQHQQSLERRNIEFEQTMSLLNQIETQVQNQILGLCEVVDRDISQVNTYEKLKLIFRFEKRTAEREEGQLEHAHLKVLKNNKYLYQVTSKGSKKMADGQLLQKFANEMRSNILLSQYFVIPLLDEVEPKEEKDKKKKSKRKSNK